MGYIFISYSHKDQAYINKLQATLQNEGFGVWIDDRIDYGTTWPTVIQKHLDDCDAFIVVMTENAFESGWVQNEVARARRKNKPFFALLLRGDTWLSVEAIQYENVVGEKLPQERFYESLARVTKRKKEASSLPVTSEVPSIDDEQSAELSNVLSFPKYTSFQEDLITLIGYVMDNFTSVRGDPLNTYQGGFTSYKSKFSFEYSTNNTIWQLNDKWYFTCTFCKDTTLQQAKMIFDERVQEIKSALLNEWKFQVRDRPDNLYINEFEAIKKYNTLRIIISVIAYDPLNKTQVDFKLEQLDH